MNLMTIVTRTFGICNYQKDYNESTTTVYLFDKSCSFLLIFIAPGLYGTSWKGHGNKLMELLEIRTERLNLLWGCGNTTLRQLNETLYTRGWEPRYIGVVVAEDKGWKSDPGRKGQLSLDYTSSM